MAFYLRPETLEAVLDGLTVWGKTKYEEILQLISSVGAPFVEPLFRRLAEERSLSLRRFYMERLQDLGAPARAYALRNLRDRRWYVVRNCIVLLRHLGDPSVVGHLRQVADHPHARVRQELIRTLLRFEHPAVDRLIAREMGAGDTEMQKFAVHLAGESNDPAVFERLRAVLTAKALSDGDYDLKAAAVRSLAKIGNPAIFPSFERILAARTILRSGRLHQLKEEIVRSLESYPYDEAMPLVTRVEKSGNPEIAAVAASVRQVLEARRYEL
jgi:HEAT repeat protein